MQDTKQDAAHHASQAGVTESDPPSGDGAAAEASPPVAPDQVAADQAAPDQAASDYLRDPETSEEALQMSVAKALEIERRMLGPDPSPYDIARAKVVALMDGAPPSMSLEQLMHLYEAIGLNGVVHGLLVDRPPYAGEIISDLVYARFDQLNELSAVVDTHLVEPIDLLCIQPEGGAVTKACTMRFVYSDERWETGALIDAASGRVLRHDDPRGALARGDQAMRFKVFHEDEEDVDVVRLDTCASRQLSVSLAGLHGGVCPAAILVESVAQSFVSRFSGRANAGGVLGLASNAATLNASSQTSDLTRDEFVTTFFESKPQSRALIQCRSARDEVFDVPVAGGFYSGAACHPGPIPEDFDRASESPLPPAPAFDAYFPGEGACTVKLDVNRGRLLVDAQMTWGLRLRNPGSVQHTVLVPF